MIVSPEPYSIYLRGNIATGSDTKVLRNLVVQSFGCLWLPMIQEFKKQLDDPLVKVSEQTATASCGLYIV